MSKQWFVYILRCKDDTLYTGMTDDLEKRLTAHNAGKGAKYTRGRGPVSLVYSVVCNDKSDALRRELQIKKMSRAEKQLLCSEFSMEG